MDATCHDCGRPVDAEDCDDCRPHCDHCDGPRDSAADREIARDRIEHPEWFDPFD